MADKIKDKSPVVKIDADFAEYGTIWFTSDLHFDHANIIKYCNRPYSGTAEMNRDLISKWNSCVRPEDLVIVLGDFGYMGVARGQAIMSQLNGAKWLILGNHDDRAGRMRRMGFSEVYREVLLVCRGVKLHLSHYPYGMSRRAKIKTYIKSFFNLLGRYKWRINIGIWRNFVSRMKELDNRPSPVSGYALLHGHTHQKETVKNGCYHVGVDSHGLCPVSLHDIKPFAIRKQYASED